MALHKLLAFVVFALAYIVIAAGKLPRLSLDRAAGALAGAVAMGMIGGYADRPSPSGFGKAASVRA